MINSEQINLNRTKGISAEPKIVSIDGTEQNQTKKTFDEIRRAAERETL